MSSESSYLERHLRRGYQGENFNCIRLVPSNNFDILAVFYIQNTKAKTPFESAGKRWLFHEIILETNFCFLFLFIFKYHGDSFRKNFPSLFSSFVSSIFHIILRPILKLLPPRRPYNYYIRA